jgi:hypothetical protein
MLRLTEVTSIVSMRTIRQSADCNRNEIALQESGAFSFESTPQKPAIDDDQARHDQDHSAKLERLKFFAEKDRAQ